MHFESYYAPAATVLLAFLIIQLLNERLNTPRQIQHQGTEAYLTWKIICMR